MMEKQRQEAIKRVEAQEAEHKKEQEALTKELIEQVKQLEEKKIIDAQKREKVRVILHSLFYKHGVNKHIKPLLFKNKIIKPLK